MASSAHGGSMTPVLQERSTCVTCKVMTFARFGCMASATSEQPRAEASA